LLLDEFTLLFELLLLLTGSLLVFELVLVLLSNEVLLSLLGSLVAVEPESILLFEMFAGSFVAEELFSSVLNDEGSLIALDPFILSVLKIPLSIFIGLLVEIPSSAVLLSDDALRFILPSDVPIVVPVVGALLIEESPLLFTLVIMRPLPTPLPYPLIEPWCP